MEKTLSPLAHRRQRDVPPSHFRITVARRAEQHDGARNARACAVLGRRVHSNNCCRSAGTRVRGESGRPRAMQFLLLISDAGRAVTYYTNIRLSTLDCP